jgi:hypothetical protein
VVKIHVRLSVSHAYSDDSFYCHVMGHFTANEAETLKRSSPSTYPFLCFIEFVRYYEDRVKFFASLLCRLPVCVSNEMEFASG